MNAPTSAALSPAQGGAAARWLAEAAEARNLAASFKEPEAQRSMLDVAAVCEQLARLEVARSATALPDDPGPGASS